MPPRTSRIIDLISACRHSFSGSCNNRSIAFSSKAPIWPSLARWSAARLTVTSGRASILPSTTHGRVDMLPKPIIATCGGYMMPITVSAPRSPRLVTVTVGELEFRAAQPAAAGALHEIAHCRHQLRERSLIGIADRRRHQSAAAQRYCPADMNSGARLEGAVDISAVQLRHRAQRQCACLQQQHCRQQSL